MIKFIRDNVTDDSMLTFLDKQQLVQTQRELFFSNILGMGAGPNIRIRPSSRPSIEFCS